MLLSHPTVSSCIPISPLLTAFSDRFGPPENFPATLSPRRLVPVYFLFPKTPGRDVFFYLLFLQISYSVETRYALWLPDPFNLATS